MGIHVIIIRHTEFRKYEKPGPKQQLVDIMDDGSHNFFTKNVYTFLLPRVNILLYRPQVQYRNSNASRLINRFDHGYT